ncbi:MAG: hypothetical protein IBX50_08250 [Marinospirillum sp.]|uniref:type IV toxin-antitoxin system AbiEi family antitoxin n=1 Tax=Marinospirillum sp. TaxID=2183934 RepID=UPI001A027A72|nr:hypothetical protein [Marinospirillum sp.]MBE0506697.1 hypothetical protein [Marinospirillum sp.]
MKARKLDKTLKWLDRQGRYVVSLMQMRTLFPDDAEAALLKGVQRAVKDGTLILLTSGIYLNPAATSNDGKTLEWVARLMRNAPLEYSYISLESALAAYGLISQIPVDRITVMTTGRKGEIKTPYGTVEFTHTSRPLSEVLKSFKYMQQGDVLPMATSQAAIRDLRRTGRNLHLLLDHEELGDE